jgi:gliding motility-associated-like protein
MTGCDSIVHTNLTVILPATLSPVISGVCQVTYKGVVYTGSTNFADTVKSSLTGCDSIYNSVIITVIPARDTTINKGVCIYSGQSYMAGGQNQTTTGIYRDTIHTTAGLCDSVIIVTDLKVITTQTIGTKTDSCNQITAGGVTYTSDTVLHRTQQSIYGCDSIIYADTLNILNNIPISIVSSDTLPIVAGDPTTLSISPAGSYSNIVWSPDQTISSTTDITPVVNPSQNTVYTVVAQDANHCTVKATINVTVKQPEEVDFIMPTAFSPNGDGRNDTFKPKLRIGSEIVDFRIYNRWGELVYDFHSNVSDGWDGSYKTVNQPIGVYAYYISVKTATGKTLNQQGNQTLLR